MMVYGGLKHRLELIRWASRDLRNEIKNILDRNDRISIAVVNIDSYTQDLYKLMRETARTANPILREMGLKTEAIEKDIREFVEILADNQTDGYFASINLDAKYIRNRKILILIEKWLRRLEKCIDVVEAFLDSGIERRELKRLFGIIDNTGLSKKKKDELKKEFVETLNRLNRA